MFSRKQQTTKMKRFHVHVTHPDYMDYQKIQNLVNEGKLVCQQIPTLDVEVLASTPDSAINKVCKVFPPLTRMTQQDYNKGTFQCVANVWEVTGLTQVDNIYYRIG